jgi:myo-inositol-1(or 4)-monophosphatase
VFVPAAREAAQRAGAAMMRGYRKRPRADQKGPIDFVTEFDRESERIVLEGLGGLGVPIIAEESDGSRWSIGSAVRSGVAPPVALYIDPLDGTTNFLHGHPFFAASIGVLVDDKPLAGVVLAPALGVEWSAVVGRFARRNGDAIEVSETSSLDAALLATGFPYDRRTSDENNFAAYLALKKICRGVRRCGSAAIDLCLVADGTYDGYWERKLSPWDLAAGAALVLGAGGHISDFSGAPAQLRSGYVMASNGRLHEALQHTVAHADMHLSPELNAALSRHAHDCSRT